MLDLIAIAKEEKLGDEIIGSVEAIYEYSLGEIAETYYKKNSDKNWSKSYAFAASYLNTEDYNIKKLQSSFPPILDIHPETKLTNLKAKHFMPLMLSKDPEAVIQAFVNIERWNYGKDKSDWARNIIEDLINQYNNYVGEDFCQCIRCNYKMEHVRGVPCSQIKCPNCNSIMLGNNCVAKLVVPPSPDDIYDEKEDKFIVDLARVKRSKKESPRPLERAVEATEEFLCVCPKCGLEMQSTGRACETIECPKCPGTYLMVKE